MDKVSRTYPSSSWAFISSHHKQKELALWSFSGVHSEQRARRVSQLHKGHHDIMQVIQTSYTLVPGNPERDKTAPTTWSFVEQDIS
jgi:hypothetical protein